MFFADKSDLISLNFAPRSHCFSQARVEWNDIVLNSQVCESKALVDLSAEEPSDVLFDVFGDLSFVEIAELYAACTKISGFIQKISWPLFCQRQDMQWNEKTEQLCEAVAQLPPKFLAWAHKKQASPRDLQPLMAIKDLAVVSPLLEHFESQAPSRSQGKMIIDLLVDLTLSNHDQTSLEPDKQSAWYDKLYKMRNPMTVARDKTLREDEQWPQYVQIHNQRQGDRIVKKMQILYSDNKDLSKKLGRLSEMEHL